METKELVIEVARANPGMTLREIGAKVGRSAERVRQILAAEGVRVPGRKVSGGSRRKGVPVFDRRKPAPKSLDRYGLAITPATIGNISELYAAIDLARRGYGVFRSMLVHAECDLIALKGGVPLRVEVKTGNAQRNGGIWCVRPRNDRWDVLAKVLPDGAVFYELRDGVELLGIA